MTTVCVTGGRLYSNARRVAQVLDAARERLGLTNIVHGAGTGADELAAAWARERGVPAHDFPADWSDLTQPGAVIRTRSGGEKYDAMAGPRRNQRMLDEAQPEIVIAFRGGAGTHDCVKRAETMGIRVIRIDWGED